MFVRLFTGGIERPSGPPVSETQFRAPIRITSANANVDKIKNGPRNLEQINARDAPKIAASNAPHQMPIHGVIPYRKKRIVEV
jgi:hypothetical protein